MRKEHRMVTYGLFPKEKIMSRNILRSLAIGAIGILLASFCLAQSTNIGSSVGERYVISANAGGVNFTEGPVTVVRKAGTSGRLMADTGSGTRRR